MRHHPNILQACYIDKNIDKRVIGECLQLGNVGKIVMGVPYMHVII